MSNYQYIAISAKITDLETAMREENRRGIHAERKLAEGAPDLMMALISLLQEATIHGVEGASFTATQAVESARKAIRKAGGSIPL